ncbi:hypothetical protein HK096_010383 [Nowakowskiella sp. JEL0078]|nr:hypothetical protein HK096_010383 [Nowakowskiella sp. JEL0078]
MFELPSDLNLGENEEIIAQLLKEEYFDILNLNIPAELESSKISEIESNNEVSEIDIEFARLLQRQFDYEVESTNSDFALANKLYLSEKEQIYKFEEKTQIFVQDLIQPKYSSTVATQYLQQELQNVLIEQQEIDSKSSIFAIDTELTKNLYNWRISLKNFKSSCKIAETLKMHSMSEIETEILFDHNFPHSPPFVRIVRPHFTLLSTEPITPGGSICIEILTLTGWSPKNRIDTLLQAVHQLLSSLDTQITLDRRGEYSLVEAMYSFHHIAAQKKWKMPTNWQIAISGNKDDNLKPKHAIQPHSPIFFERECKITETRDSDLAKRLQNQELLNAHNPIIYRRVISSTSATTYEDDSEHWGFVMTKYNTQMGGRNNASAVEYVVNQAAHEIYYHQLMAAKASCVKIEEVIAFHGTMDLNVESILESGFRIGGRDGHPMANGALLGQGVYLSTNPLIAIGYAKGSNRLLVVKVLLAQQDHNQNQVIVAREKERVLPLYVLHIKMTAESATSYDVPLQLKPHFEDENSFSWMGSSQTLSGNLKINSSLSDFRVSAGSKKNKRRK